MRQTLCRIFCLVLITGCWPMGLAGQGPVSGALARCDSLSRALNVARHKPNNDEEVLALSAQLMEEARAAGSLKYLGRSYYFEGCVISAGEDREAGLEMLHTATRLLKAAGDSAYLARALYGTAATEYLMEDMDMAQLHAEEAVDKAGAIGDTSLLMLSVNIIALIQKELGNYQAAIDYLLQGMDKVNLRGRYYLMQNLGVIYKEKGDYEAARSCFARVADFYERMGFQSELAIACNNLATVALRTHNPSLALEYLQKADENLAADASPRLRGLVLLNTGVAHRDLGDCKRAAVEFAGAGRILGRLGERKNLAVAMENEAECRFLLGETRLAYLLLDSAKVIGDSLADIGRTQSIAVLEQKFRQQSQRQRIEDLRKENAIILERNLAIAESAHNQRIALVLLLVIVAMLSGLGFLFFRLQRSRYQRRLEADKQLLLRQQIKPHFIFNAMNSIQHFLVHDRKKEGLIYLGKFGELLRSILNNSEKDLVPVAEELKLIRHYMDMERVRSNEKFDYEIVVDPAIDTDELHMPGMVLQMLVENAIWHGIAPKEGRGLIQVLVRRNEGRIEVAVRDDGVGLHAEVKSPPLHRKSFGLELVRQRVRRLSWNKISYLFSLEEEKDTSGQVKGTLARIIMEGKLST